MAFHATLLKTVGGIAGAGGGLSAGADFGSDAVSATGGRQSGTKLNNVSSGGGVPAWVIGVAVVAAIVLLRKGAK